MKDFALRCLIAVVAVLIVFALIPPVLHIIGFSMVSDVNTIFRIVVAVVALYYIVWGPPVPLF